MASHVTSLTIVYSTVYSGADQRKFQSSTSLAVVRVIRRLLVNSPHKGPVTRKMFPFEDVIMWKVTFSFQFYPEFNTEYMNVSLKAVRPCDIHVKTESALFYIIDHRGLLDTEPSIVLSAIKPYV